MATQSKASRSKASRSKGKGADAQESPNEKIEAALQPFQEAAQRFFETTSSAQQSAAEHWGKTCLELQEEVRRLEQEAYNAVAERSQSFFNALGQEAKGQGEEDFSVRAKRQLEHESEIQKIYIDTQSKLAATAEKLGGGTAEDIAQRLAELRQQAYQEYLGDLQRAWAATEASDPQTMSAIALNILSTIHSCTA